GCPYQVLDIIRDFDKEFGFNIRILNWWGRGLFIFVFFGRHNRKFFSDAGWFPEMQQQGYSLTNTSSPWDYKTIIDLGNMSPMVQESQVIIHIERHRHLQLVKKIAYTEDYLSLKRCLREQVLKILNLYSRYIQIFGFKKLN